MRIKVIPDDHSSEEPADYRDWKPWFAWYPVLIAGTLVWLETVERQKVGFYPATFLCPHDYRTR